MRFYDFGKRDGPVLLLLPGTCCHWKRNFGHVIALVEQDFHVVCASYDGFDETEDTVFPDMLTETARIEDHLLAAFGGHILAAYGCSMGGSFVGLLVQRGRVHIDHAILGSSDLDQAGRLVAQLQARLVSRVLYGMLQKGQLPGWMRKRLEAKPPEQRAYMDEMLKLFGIGGPGMAFVRRESIRRQFYSDLVTPLEDAIDMPGTTVHIFYALKMGDQYEARYRRHFRQPDIRRQDLQHEELLCCYPHRWAEELRQCCRMMAEAEA